MRLSVLLCLLMVFVNPIFSQSITTKNMAYFETVVNHSENKIQSAGVLIGGITIFGFSTVAVISGFSTVIYGGNLILTGEGMVLFAPFAIMAGAFLFQSGIYGMALGASFSVPAIHGLTLSDEEKRRISGDIQVLKNRGRKNEKIIKINNQEQIIHDLR